VIGWLADHKALNSRISDMIHLQSQSSNCCAHHAITVIDQLYCFSVKRKQAVAEEELHSVVVQLEADGLQERDVVTQNLLILKVKVHSNNFVYVIVAKEIEDGCFALNILQPKAMCIGALAIHDSIFCVTIADTVRDDLKRSTNIPE